MEAILRRVLRQLAKDFEGMEVGWPEDGLDGLQAEAAQQRLHLLEGPRKARRRVAVLEGFSLHADTAVHANDREGLARLCRYGSRGPLCLERLTRREVSYQSKLSEGMGSYAKAQGWDKLAKAAELNTKTLVSPEYAKSFSAIPEFLDEMQSVSKQFWKEGVGQVRTDVVKAFRSLAGLQKRGSVP